MTEEEEPADQTTDPSPPLPLPLPLVTDKTARISPPVSASPMAADELFSLRQSLREKGIAYFGNGRDDELSMEQYELVLQLYEETTTARQELHTAENQNHPPENSEGSTERSYSCWFGDYETCRRYLVARQWKYDAALAQLQTTLEWRRQGHNIEGRLGGISFAQSPKCVDNPWALSMRPAGWDLEGRPICYTSFAEAHDRWDSTANTVHMTLLLEAIQTILWKRRQDQLNDTATSRQCIWVIDFDGFGWRDQNPKSGILTAQLLQHYPEILNLAVLINAPRMFSGMYKLIQSLLDDRVRQKIQFVTYSAEQNTGSKGSYVSNTWKVLRERLGDETIDWILAEMQENRKQRARLSATSSIDEQKQYWKPPTAPNQHDSRGLSEYVKSKYYIETPGDRYLKQQENNAESQVRLSECE